MEGVKVPGLRFPIPGQRGCISVRRASVFVVVIAVVVVIDTVEFHHRSCLYSAGVGADTDCRKLKMGARLQ
jgi:hypothetical protein